MAERVLHGALRLWGVQGTVSRERGAFMLCTDTGMKVQIARAAPRGWVVLQDNRPLGEAAGLPGLLRLLREELAPRAARGRLIVGSPLR